MTTTHTCNRTCMVWYAAKS